MATEFEATFLNIDKEKLRTKLKEVGAILVHPEYKQKTYHFSLEPLGKNFSEYARIRDDNGKITMAYKNIPYNSSIEDQKEIEFEISDMEKGVDLLQNIGAKMLNYAEKLREHWELDEVEIDIDSWPYLETYAEIEGKNEEEIKKVAKKLGFDYKDAKFCSAGQVYKMKYGIHPDDFSKLKEELVRITFDDPNPFLK